MNKFVHKPYKFEALKQVTLPSGIRFYETPTGQKHPSVTTVISEMSSKDHLIAWRERVGDEEADRITKEACERGTAVHKKCEDYMFSYLGNENVEEEVPENIQKPFEKIKTVVDKNIKIVHNTEFPLYSDKIRTAGTCDLFCQYDYVPSIVDFKTARQFKKEEWINKHFIQATAYALMLYEIHGVVVPQIVIIIAADGVDKAQVFVKKTKDFVRETLDIFQRFHESSNF